MGREICSALSGGVARLLLLSKSGNAGRLPTGIKQPGCDLQPWTGSGVIAVLRAWAQHPKQLCCLLGTSVSSPKGFPAVGWKSSPPPKAAEGVLRGHGWAPRAAASLLQRWLRPRGDPQSLQVTKGLSISHPHNAARSSVLSHTSCPPPPWVLGALVRALPIPSAREQAGNRPAERRSQAEVRSLFFLEVVGLLQGSLGLPRAGRGPVAQSAFS